MPENRALCSLLLFWTEPAVPCTGLGCSPCSKWAHWLFTYTFFRAPPLLLSRPAAVIVTQDLPLFQIPAWFGRLCRIKFWISDLLLPSQKGLESDCLFHSFVHVVYVWLMVI